MASRGLTPPATFTPAADMPTFDPIPSANASLTIACAMTIALPTMAHAQSAPIARRRAPALDYMKGRYRERRTHGARGSPGSGEADHEYRPARTRMLGHQRDDARPQHARRRREQTLAAEQRKEVRILDIFGNAASVRVDAGTWSIPHVARWNDRWVIVNVLWELRPQLQATIS